MPPDRNKRIVFASAVGLTQRGVQLIAALISLPIVLHTLGLSDFGVWGAATSLAWLSGMVDLGLGSALMSLLPRSIAAGRADTAREQLSAALVGSCGPALLLLGAGAALELGHIRHEEASSMLVAAIGLALNIPLSVAGYAWFGLQRGHVAGMWELMQTCLTLVVLLLASLCHAGVVIMVAVVYGSAALTNACSLLHLLIRHPEIRPSHRLITWNSLSGVFKQGGALYIITLAVSSSYLFDNFLTLQLVGPNSSAQMAIAMRICTTAAGMIGVATQPLWPAFVEASTLGDRRWMLRAVLLGTSVVVLVTVIGASLIVAFGGRLLGWWLRADVGIQPLLLWAIGGWLIALCVPRVITLLLTALAEFRLQFWVAVSAAISSLGLKFVLAHAYGAAGILAATPMCWLLMAWPAYAWKIAQRIVSAASGAGINAKC